MYKGMSCFTLLPKGQAYDKEWRTSYTLSYSFKCLRYLNIPLSISEFTNKNNTKPYNNALYIPTRQREIERERENPMYE